MSEAARKILNDGVATVRVTFVSRTGESVTIEYTPPRGVDDRLIEMLRHVAALK